MQTKGLLTGNLFLVVITEYVKWMRLRISGAMAIVLRIAIDHTNDIVHMVDCVSSLDCALTKEIYIVQNSTRLFLVSEGGIIQNLEFYKSSFKVIW